MDAIALVIFYCTMTGDCGVTVAGSFPQQSQCMAQSQMAAAQWHGQHPDVDAREMKITCMPREALEMALRKNEA